MLVFVVWYTPGAPSMPEMEEKMFLKDAALVDLLTSLQPAVPVLCYLIHGVIDMQVLLADPMLSTKVL